MSWQSSSSPLGWFMPPRPTVKWLLILNIGIFVLSKLTELSGFYFIQHWFALSLPGILHGFLWQFITYMFLHGGVWHVLMNMLILYFFGNDVEEELGSKRFLQIYLIGGVVGASLWLTLEAMQSVVLMPLVGASGGVYAILLAFAGLFPYRPITIILFFFLPVTMYAKVWAYIAVGISVLMAISNPGDGVAHLCHLGGAAWGFLYIYLYRNGKLPSFPQIRLPKGTSKKAYPQPTQVKILPFIQPTSRNDAYIKEKIDPILDKIARQGIQSLTDEEKRILEQARDRL